MATLSLTVLALAQTPADPVIRVNVNLVQIDATVTDKAGRHIADLKADDFELFQDGKKQSITRFTFAAAGPSASGRTTSTNLGPEDVRRTIAIVIDDLSTSFESMANIRRGLKTYIEQSVKPGDLVVILRSSSGAGAYQQFTSDKRQLLATAAKIRFRLTPNSQVSSLTPMRHAPTAYGTEAEEMQRRLQQAEQDLDAFSQESFTVGTLGAMNWVVNGLRELPGRKALVLLSENVTILDRPQERQPGSAPGATAMGGFRSRTLAALQSLADLANRAGVVIYTVDPRGATSFDLTAADRADPARAARDVDRRSSGSFDSRQGLGIMAHETGGLFFSDSNDIAAQIGKATDDQEGFYLIGYNPDDAAFEKVKGNRFRRIELKVKRPGLSVRYRRGFLGMNDDERVGPPLQPLPAALMSPFGSDGIRVRLTPVYLRDGSGGYVQSMLHIDARDLHFDTEPATSDDTDRTPWRKASIEAMVVSFGENGEAVDQTARSYTIRLRGPAFDAAILRGLLQSVNHPIKRPGSYQLRAAVFDPATRKTGAAAQFIETPDSSKRVALAGLTVSSSSWPQSEDTQGAPAVRLFRPGEKLRYSAYVHGAKRDKTSRQTIETQVTLQRDGVPVFTGRRTPLSADAKNEVLIGGELTLSPNAVPGDYEVVLTVVDLAANPRRNVATAAIDFEVRKR